MLHTGIAWRDLPQEYGYGSGVTCWRRLRDWQQAGVWDSLHQQLLTRLNAAGQIDWSRAAVDDLEGLIDRDLAVAVAPVANWRLVSLVKALDPSSVARLLDSCDRGTRSAGATLRSCCCCRASGCGSARSPRCAWMTSTGARGELVVCGKGSRRERFPLPVDVGEAVAAWLQDGRPDCQSRFVFTRARAPHDGLHPSALTSVVHRACGRAGLPQVGAHRLGHAAATQMLRAGSSLRDVGQVLRHRSSEVTSIYAKVDRRALSAVVRPWPGAAA